MTGQVRYETILGSQIKLENYEPGKSIQQLYDERNFPSCLPVICNVCSHASCASVEEGWVLRANWNYVPKDGEVVTFVPLPQNSPADILRTVAIIALVVSAPYIGPALGLTASGTFANTLLAAGIAIGGTFIINALLPPSTPPEIAAASSVYSGSPQGNQARLGQVINKQYGTFNSYPDFVQMPYAVFENNEQYLYQLFNVELGYTDIHQVAVEDTPIWQNPPNENTDVNGYTGSYNDVELGFYEPGVPVTHFPTAVISSIEVGSQDLNEQGYVSGPYVANPPETSANVLQLDFVMSNGVWYVDDDGDMQPHSITLSIVGERIDDDGFPTGEAVELAHPTFTYATKTPQRVTVPGYVPDGRWRVKCARMTPHTTDARYGNDIAWTGLKAFIEDDNVYPNITCMSVKIRLTGQIAGQATRRFKVLKTTKIPTIVDGAWTAPVATRSIAWAAADMLRNSVYGRGKPDVQIDLAKLIQLDELWTLRGDTFDGIFDSSRTAWDALCAVLRAGRAYPVQVGSVITFIRDEPQDIVKGVYTPGNIIEGSWETTHVMFAPDSPTSVTVSYIDERSWTLSTVTCSTDAVVSSTPARIDGFGIVQKGQAIREGLYQAAVNKYRRLLATFETEMQGKIHKRGDAITCSFDVPNWGISGQVTSYDPATYLFTLDEDIDFEGYTSAWLLLTQHNGYAWGPLKVYPTADPFKVTTNALDLEDAETRSEVSLATIMNINSQADLVKFIFGPLRAGKTFKVISIQHTGEDRVSLAVTIDDPRVYEFETIATSDNIDTGSPTIQLPNIPSIALVTAVITGGIDPVDVTISWTPGTFNPSEYVVEYSYNGAVYLPLTTTASTTTSTTLAAGALRFRVAAITGGVKGPYAGTLAIAAPVTGPPLVPTGLTASTPGYNRDVIVNWNSMLRATSYTAEVWISGAMEISRVVFAPSTIFTGTDLRAAGGPWTDIVIKVKSTNSDGSSAFASFTIPTLPITYDIELDGDVSATGNIGSPITVTLDSVVAAGTGTKVTYNTKGLVTSSTILSVGDIPTLTSAKVSDFDTQVRTSRLDQMAVPTADVALGAQKITGLANGVSSQDAVTLAQLNAVQAGLDIKASVRAATTANITLSAPQTIDGVSVIAGDRVLVKDQSTGANNGIYIVAVGAWTRASDADTSSEVTGGMFTFVAEGTLNADTGWVLTTNDPITLGSTSLAFSKFTSPGSYTADGISLTLTGTQFSINASWVGQTSITTLGTVTTGTWNAGAVTSSGNVSAGAASAFRLGTTTFANLSSNYTAVYEPAGNVAMYLGNATDPINYYDNTGHVWRLRASGATLMSLSASGLDVASKKITSVTNPTTAQDAATKNYVDTNLANVSVHATPTNPTATTSTSAVMMGLGSSCTITPAFKGRVFLQFTGYMFNNTGTGLETVQIRYGTGVAPANGAAASGTTLGAATKGTSGVANDLLPFSLVGILTGLTPGTPIWVDLSCFVNGGTGTLAGITFTAIEL